MKYIKVIDKDDTLKTISNLIEKAKSHNGGSVLLLELYYELSQKKEYNIFEPDSEDYDPYVGIDIQ